MYWCISVWYTFAFAFTFTLVPIKDCGYTLITTWNDECRRRCKYTEDGINECQIPVKKCRGQILHQYTFHPVFEKLFYISFMYTYLNIYRTYNNLGCIGVFMYGILMFPLRTVD